MIFERSKIYLGSDEIDVLHFDLLPTGIPKEKTIKVKNEFSHLLQNVRITTLEEYTSYVKVKFPLDTGYSNLTAYSQTSFSVGDLAAGEEKTIDVRMEFPGYSPVEWLAEPDGWVWTPGNELRQCWGIEVFSHPQHYTLEGLHVIPLIFLHGGVILQVAGWLWLTTDGGAWVWEESEEISKCWED